ncbi:T9SS type A sorting domain-containing protein [uncultured Algibacter sp.]|uniref:T9SS type A sorting domain-containing protein n=1 Tax=uncultured Algibacter sp. TaxID=298659 RepID=UPI00262F5C71|nr:T9SS type A sorting domain-containing protein [uncultured Algibacter sp.]
MKTKLLLLLLCVSVFGYAQVQPAVLNNHFNKIPKSSGSDCSCSGWMNKDIGDQGGSSTDIDGSGSNDGVKFDKNNDDIIYQEVEVLANTEYKVSYSYQIEGETTSTSKLEIRILKGSEYKDGYTPAYEDTDNAPSSGFGYETLASVEDGANNLISAVLVDPTADDEYYTAEFTFNSGSETSIALFARGIGGADPGVGGSPKGFDFINGDESVRLDYMFLTNEVTASVEDLLASNFNIYPNPAKDYVSIVSKNITIRSVEIYNVIGKRLLVSNILNDNKLNISSLNSGVYLLKINANGKSVVKKIVKE